MKRFRNMLFSMELSGFLLVIFAIAIAIATFIENDYGTNAAKVLVYNARWFEFLLLLTSINLAGTIIVRKLYLRNKFNIFAFHIAFLIILTGAAITRYFSYEGMMHIREGEHSDYISSTNNYLKLFIEDDKGEYYVDKAAILSPLSKKNGSMRIRIGGDRIDIKATRLIPNAVEQVVDAVDGSPLLSLIFLEEGSRREMLIKEGEMRKLGQLKLGFNNNIADNDISFILSDSGLFLKSVVTTDFFNMVDNEEGSIEEYASHEVQQMLVYRIKDQTFVVNKVYAAAKVTYIAAAHGETSNDVLEVEAALGDEKMKLFLAVGGVNAGSIETFILGKYRLHLTYGTKRVNIPFALRLDEFILERYPGSQSPSSFTSIVTLIDEDKGVKEERRIFMNNILNYRGYRFFQSSYDTDEKGTILSVSYDFWGTIISYFGYFILTLFMILTFFSRQSRIRKLFRKLKTLHHTAAASVFVLLILSVTGVSAQNHQDYRAPSREHSRSFASLIVQDHQGRIKPANSMSSEVLRKLSRKSKFMGLNPDQVMLGIISNPDYWRDVEMIRVSDPALKKIIGINGKYASFNQIVDINSENGYKLGPYVEEANRKKSIERSRFDKDVIAVDERLNIFYYVYIGHYLRIFPKKNDPNNRWFSSSEAWKNFNGDDSFFVSNIMHLYTGSLIEASRSNDYKAAERHLESIKNFQIRNGDNVIPAAGKIRMEILYNNLMIFNRLKNYYGIFGFVFLILFLTSILNRNFRIKAFIPVSVVIFSFGFLLHSFGMALRWYVGGHAPWTNSYETMIFIAWSAILAGLIVTKRSPFTLSATALLAALILLVAHLNWLNPEISSLVPVLKSYWLIIHVAVITSSYGFFGIAALLGFISLLIMVFLNKNNRDEIKHKLDEFTVITEIALIIGLMLMTIGSFLGAVWANESWGRYWGWDPKETWALVTILVYSFIIHMRHIPGFRGAFAFSFAALIALGAVIMTYFGVNYYLSGLHSYATGDPVPIPSFLYYSLGVIIIISGAAYFKFNLVFKDNDMGL